MEDEDFIKTESDEGRFLFKVKYSDYPTRDLLRKKCHKPAIRILRNMSACISCLLNCGDDDVGSRGKYLVACTRKYLEMIPVNRKKREHMQLFEYYEMFRELVRLYKSPIKNNKEIAEESFRLFLHSNILSFPVPTQHRFASLILQLCYRLRDHKTTSERLLYHSCRQTYEALVKSIGLGNTRRLFYCCAPDTFVRDFYHFIRELTQQLLVNMKLIRESCFCRVPPELKSRFERDVVEFSTFTLHTCTNIKEHVISILGLSLDSLPMVASEDVMGKSNYVKELKPFYDDFSNLLNSVDLGLTYMDDGVEYTRCTQCEFNHGWCYYLSILKELDMISKIYHPAQKNLSSCLSSHRDSINKLVMRSKRGDDHQWLLRYKSLLNNESREHLITVMFPDQVKNGCDHMKVIIDKSKLFVDSFEHVGLANAILLRNGITVQFKNEVAFEASPGILKEWFFLVCQHLFTPQNSLFVSCPHDPQRLYPNPGKVNSQQLEYYRFCGRIIALPMMHDVQIGVGFDRLFFLHLSGSAITLEDIRDADPYMYKSCKDILEMDTKFIDSNGLGLTFVWETEEVDESGSRRKNVELCPGGSTMVVCSLNREEYIELVIQHCFVRSIAEKVKLFTRGLDDVLTRSCRKRLFQSIELEDLDHMLLEGTICETNREEPRNHNEAVDGRTTPFHRIIETTLPVSRQKSSYLPLKCRDQHRPFRFVI